MALENIPSITGDVVEADPNLMPIYEVRSQDPGLAPGELQKLYGTAEMPMFQWARRFEKEGKATFDPANQFDREAADFIASTPDQDLQAQGIDPSIKDALVQAGGFAAQAVVSKAGLQAATKAGLTGFGNAPVSSGQFTSQLMPAAKSYLPEFAGGPASYVNPDLAIPANLTPGQSLVTSKVFKTLQGAKPDLMGNAVPGNSGFMKVSTNQFNEAASLAGGDITASASAAPDPGMFESGGFFDKGTTGYTPSLGQMGMNFGIGLGVNLLMGASPKEAAKQAAISTAGTAIGTIAFGPVGGFIGGTVASIIGGRVICNELVRQGFMNRNQIILDYRFTREHLSPQHVKGYHAWAIHIVRRLRKGKGVKMWRHIATHRVNEIAYIYGERDKPDYLGKIYRHVGEKGCWLVGLFCEKSDWSVLYKTKEA